MRHARPEYAITVAILGVLLAIGIPALRRGQLLVGVSFTVLAAAVAGWALLAIVRQRRP
jgi:hypothetical protein